MRKTIMMFLILSVVLSCKTTRQNGETYYIDTITGDDSYKGNTPEKPWKSFRPLLKVVLGAGDQLLLKGGRSFNGTIELKNIAGTGTNPVLISSYGGGTAIINSGDSAAIRISNSEHVTCKNLSLRGSGRLDGNISDGLQFFNVRNVTIDSIEASGYLYSGIHVKGGSDVNITGCYAHDNGFCGIYAESGENEYGPDGMKFKTMRNVRIAHCIAVNNPGCPAITDNHSGSGILMAGVVNGIIEYCEARDNGWDMPRDGNGPVGIWAYMSDSVTIRYCYSHHNKTSPGGKDGGGFDFDGGMRYSVMEYNVSEFNEGAGYGIFQYAGATEWTGNIIRYNISYNDGIRNSQSGIFMWYDPVALPMKDFHAYLNTVYSSYGHAVSFEPGDYQGFLFEGNLFCLADNPGAFVSGVYSSAEFMKNTWCIDMKEGISIRKPAEDPEALLKMPDGELLDLIRDERRAGNQAAINDRIRVHFEQEISFR